MSTNPQAAPQISPEFLGHPPGLFTLFFAEMWERFSYYGMRALLVFYMTKGFLGFGDTRAYEVYGAYTALVYATPFIGGMLADRLLGARKSVVIGGLLMAAGHLLMTIENDVTFFTALALLICGNGFFKPNISTIVGTLYPKGSPKRDAGFTIFYIGINLGAALAPLLCGYVGETFGWHYGFGLATIGMLVGLAVFVAPSIVTQMVIGLGALAAALSMVYVGRNDSLMLIVNAPVGLALLVAAGAAIMAISKGGLPSWAGRIENQTPRQGIPSSEWFVYGGILLAIPVIAILVHKSEIAGYALTFFGVIALGTILITALKSAKVERERLFVVLILMFFSMLFWAFFEQAGSSVNNFTDRNVDRIVSPDVFTKEQVGTTIDVQANQALVGLRRGDGTIVRLNEINDVNDAFREANKEAFQNGERPTISWAVTESDVGQAYGGSEVKATIFQAVNPVCIMIFGLVFSALWDFLGKRKMEPSTPVKFALGLFQLAAGFLAFWYGASNSTDRGMTSMAFLVLGYALHTTGELCLSPVGLSMVTKLSPTRIVSTVMGGWFLATAFSNYLAGLIAKLTGVSHGGEESKVLPPPQETVNVYGDVFLKIAIAGGISAVIVLILSPLLSKWMHQDKE
ncbi:MAG: peptide MFS transporter [Phycisphaerales bacterium]|nr:MAG: peptide MFS transporter [Phycisphaerales bacterium]